MFSKAAVWLVIALVLFTVFKQFDKPRVQEGVSYSQFMDDAKNGKVKNVVVQGRNLTVTPADGQKYQIVSPGDIWMVGDLMKYGVRSRQGRRRAQCAGPRCITSGRRC
jgi:cell division protease FtsH